MKQRIKLSKVKPNVGALNYSGLLEAPAGKHGFVQVRDGHFYFEDGTRAKFFGFCISARSNTPSHEDAEKLAKRLASMGVNVVRMHAADAEIGEQPRTWSSCKEAPLLDYASGSSVEFNKEGLDRYDYLLYQLKEHGIYVHIDLIVARRFMPADGLDYPDDVPNCLKRYPMYNARMIELQKDYAKKLLTHVNPYTGLALIDEPSVMTVQINNEESAIKGCEDIQSYKDEVAYKFSHFLLSKYGSRDGLLEAWTDPESGVSALGDDEDPVKGTVQVPMGSFYQPTNDPMSAWDGSQDFMAHTAVPRYADFMEFGIKVNRDFYEDMYNFLHSIGVHVPIATSNLPAGAADVYGHAGGDVMEQDSYFNHPIFPLSDDNSYNVAGPTEYVTTNPLTAETGVGAMGTTLLSLGSIAAVDGKPMTLAEWNEYGLHPFHSTAFASTIAYACLNDWDALIVYNYHTSEFMDDQPDDEISNVFDAFDDPALICQWGFLATVFLKGLVSPSKVKADIVYTRNDLMTSPNMGYAPYMFLPYVCGTRNLFLENGQHPSADIDVAVNSGFLNDADLSGARHGVYYAWSPYRDAFRKSRDDIRLALAKKSEDNLVIDDIARMNATGNYMEYATVINNALHKWGVLPEGTGLVDGALVSDTGEIITDADKARFEIHTDKCAYYSGTASDNIKLGPVAVSARNDRISLALLPIDKDTLEIASKFALTAMGTTGSEDVICEKGQELMPGFALTHVKMQGKLYADTLEGTITVPGKSGKLTALDTVGNEIETIKAAGDNGKLSFTLDGSVPAVNFVLEVTR